MTDRNDSLLLALGWEYEVIEHDIDGTIHARTRWTSPDGKVYGDGPVGTPPSAAIPRPFDSVDDGIACVPEGWTIFLAREYDEDGDVFYCASILKNDGADPVGGYAGESDNSMSEALASAIMKALSHE